MLRCAAEGLAATRRCRDLTEGAFTDGRLGSAYWISASPTQRPDP